MNNIRKLLLTVLVDVVHTEFFGKEHINLDCNNCVFLTEYILVLNIKLRTVECGLVNTDLIVNIKVIENSFHNSL